MQKSVLIVEDDEALSSLWQIFLTEKNYKVTCCSTVADAEVLLSANKYDVIVVDIFLRNNGSIDSEGGVTLINRIHLQSVEAFSTTPKVPILVVSGTSIRSRYTPGLLNIVESLSDAVLQKPISLEVLDREIARLCAS